MTRKFPAEKRQNYGEGALRGWITRKDNEKRRAKRFDEVLAENRRLKAALRSLIAEVRSRGMSRSTTEALRLAEALLDAK